MRCVEELLCCLHAERQQRATAYFTLSQSRLHRSYVVWSRIDQKTCLKAIVAANLTPVVIELRREGDTLATDVDAIRAAIERLGPESVACVATTTSCFAPRCCDQARRALRSSCSSTHTQR
jgi:O-phospho-L-seryl-tRNASec:L-selenocysteinyl-tRNA synthase